VTDDFESTSSACGVPHAVELTEEIAAAVPAPDDVEEAAILDLEVARLRRALRELDAFDAWLLSARFGLRGDVLSIRVLGNRLGCSHTQVRRMERRALDRLRGIYAPDLDCAA
jgi:DNA-directed RNA polymerase sigma subunit (sigma70/sigma32)